MKRFLWFLVIYLITLFPSNGFAVGSGGFENASFGARSLAEANAVVAQADEPAAISYNPAGIVYLPGIRFQSDAAFISVITHYSDKEQGSTQSSGTISVLPTSYITINPGRFLGDRVAFGVGSDSPFGLGNKYDSNHPIVHYTGYKTWLKMFTIKPVMAVKLTDWLSIGGGPMYYRIFDFGTILAYPNRLVQAPFGGPVPGPPTLPLFPDGQLRLNMSGNSWGWHLGALIKPHKKHHFGFYFRSPVHIKLRGRIEVENASDVSLKLLPDPPFFTLLTSHTRSFKTGAHAKMALPLNMTFAYAFRPNDKITIETDFGYTRWQIFKRLNINADPTNPTSAADDAILKAIGPLETDYEDSFGLHIGANYKVNSRLTLRGGSHFLWTPVPNDHFRPAVPDANSLAFALGASYDLSKYLTLNTAYYNRFFLRRKIDNSISEVLGTSVDGSYFTYGQEFVIGLVCKWDDLFNKAKIDSVTSSN